MISKMATNEEEVPLTLVGSSKRSYGSIKTSSFEIQLQDQGQVITHRVSHVDTLTSLAIKYDTSTEIIKRQNGLSQDQDLHSRQFVFIGGKSRHSEQESSTKVNSVKVEEDPNMHSFFQKFDQIKKENTEQAKRTIQRFVNTPN